MSTLAIRTASLEDAGLLARTHARCFDEAWDAATFTTFLRHPSTFALVASRGGEIGAFILVRVAADEGEILSLATSPASRRSGFARALVGAAAAEAHRKGARRMFLEVAADNDPALALYQNAGFTVAGRRATYYVRAGGGAADALILSVGLPL